MRVLSRRAEEVVCIRDNIEMVLVQVRGKTVRLGIDAPREIQVDRKEINLQKHTAELPTDLENHGHQEPHCDHG